MLLLMQIWFSVLNFKSGLNVLIVYHFGTKNFTLLTSIQNILKIDKPTRKKLQCKISNE